MGSLRQRTFQRVYSLYKRIHSPYKRIHSPYISYIESGKEKNFETHTRTEMIYEGRSAGHNFEKKQQRMISVIFKPRILLNF